MDMMRHVVRSTMLQIERSSFARSTLTAVMVAFLLTMQFSFTRNIQGESSNESFLPTSLSAEATTTLAETKRGLKEEADSQGSLRVVSSISSSKCSSPTTNVLVTGITGTIGSHVARVLVQNPCYKVYGFKRLRSNEDNLIGILHQITMINGDITDGARVRQVVKNLRPDYVYHFAAQAVNGFSLDNPQMTMDTNIMGTFNLMEAVKEAGIHPRMLIAGSSCSYGKSADDYRDGTIPESALLQPVSPYGVSKLTTEKLAIQYYYSHDIPVVTARFFLQVGVGGSDSFALHQFSRQIALAEAGVTEAVVRHGNLQTTRDMTDPRDSAPIVVQLAEKGVPGEAYNVGSGNAYTIQHLLDLAISKAKIPIQAEVDKSLFRLYDEPALVADNAKVCSLTGWVPKTDLSETVGLILDYWRMRVRQLYTLPKETTIDVN